MKEKITSAEVVKTASGRQYHINVAPGELAEYIILVGDPARAHKVAKFFDKIEFNTQNREFITYTGYVDNIRMSVMSTGIGQDNIEIVFIETIQVVENPTFIRVGSCGSLQEQINCGDLVISTGSVRLENTSLFFVPEGYPAVANYEVIISLIEAAEKLGYRYHVGLTASASGFYGAQGRNIPGFRLRYPNLVEELKELNVVNFEMESSALFTLSNIKSIRAGMVCAVYANRPKNEFIGPEEKVIAEEKAIKTGIEAFKILAKIDKAKKKNNKKYWYLGLKLE
ncbi:MAG: nucleoside phosphorylase [Candidatus Asgardarchaeum sp.]